MPWDKIVATEEQWQEQGRLAWLVWACATLAMLGVVVAVGMLAAAVLP